VFGNYHVYRFAFRGVRDERPGRSQKACTNENSLGTPATGQQVTPTGCQVPQCGHHSGGIAADAPINHSGVLSGLTQYPIGLARLGGHHYPACLSRASFRQ
jgi:hypothetical protein